jgi:hypothetical protein
MSWRGLLHLRYIAHRHHGQSPLRNHCLPEHTCNAISYQPLDLQSSRLDRRYRLCCLSPSNRNQRSLLLGRQCQYLSSQNLQHLFREAVFKAGTISATPRMINALLAVKEELEALRVADEGAYRDPNKTIETLHHEVVDMFCHTYGESSEATRELLKGVHPDFGTPPFPRGEKG